MRGPGRCRPGSASNDGHGSRRDCRRVAAGAPTSITQLAMGINFVLHTRACAIGVGKPDEAAFRANHRSSLSSPSNAFASFRSTVSKPSVKPAVDFHEHRARLVAAALFREEPAEAHRRAHSSELALCPRAISIARSKQFWREYSYRVERLPRGRTEVTARDSSRKPQDAESKRLVARYFNLQRIFQELVSADRAPSRQAPSCESRQSCDSHRSPRTASRNGRRKRRLHAQSAWAW